MGISGRGGMYIREDAALNGLKKGRRVFGEGDYRTLHVYGVL
jgi:hypothetical protein